jgi:hypothetical protein
MEQFTLCKFVGTTFKHSDFVRLWYSWTHAFDTAGIGWRYRAVAPSITYIIAVSLKSCRMDSECKWRHNFLHGNRQNALYVVPPALLNAEERKDFSKAARLS